MAGKDGTMGADAPGIAIRRSAQADDLSRLITLGPIPPALVHRPPAPAPGRTKIWEFATNLHCSIIGTCLSTAELRQILKKLGAGSPTATDHTLHGIAVTLAGRHVEAARQLHKALDHRHKLAVAQFAKAATQDQVRAMWDKALEQGDIPGAYWATLTHPATTRALIADAFGAVHMLSHLIGSANRADIRRLCQLEAEKTALTERLEQQQAAAQAAMASRDAQIAELRQELGRQVSREPIQTDDDAGLRARVADLEQRLGAEAAHRGALADRLAAARAALAGEQSARLAAERESEALRQELEAIEASLLPPPSGTDSDTAPVDLVVLYVGGRPNQVAHLRAAAERLGATLLHHDGGIEAHQALLPGLVSRSDWVVFPVDCISHDAANAVKTLCRQAGKRFVPLRSSGTASLLAELRRPAAHVLRDAAD